jgi:hypothetical protein
MTVGIMRMSNLLSGLALGGVTGAVVLMADAVTASTINLRDAAGIIVFISGLVWWMGRKFAAIEAKMEQHHQLLSDLPCAYCNPGNHKRNHK